MIRLCVNPLALDISKEHYIIHDGNSDIETGYFSFSYFSVITFY